MKKAFAFVLIFGFIASFIAHIPHALATDWPVHANSGKKIQDTIEDPNVLDGDSIILHPGIYYETIDFWGKAITLRSTEPNDPNVVAATIIDGGQAGTVVTFEEGEDPNSVLSGITIRNGNNSDSDSYGGGIYCIESSPVITNCIITENIAESYGGGIYCSDSSPIIVNCIIKGNTAEYIGYDYRGGGGIYFIYSSPDIINCTINGNSARDGGGIHCFCSSPNIIDCTIKGNTAGYGGGGVCCLEYSSPSLTNCIINGNMAYYGGGVRCSSKSAPILTNCIISRNAADKDTNYGGGIYSHDASPIVTNCILWDNSPNEIQEFSSDLNVTYCCIQDGYPGEGNMNTPPLFVDPNEGDYHLQSGSPCIDAGTNTGAPSEDKDGLFRPQDGNGDGLAICDIGTYEYIEMTVLSPGLNLVSFPQGFEKVCPTDSCLWDFYNDQNLTLVKMQTYLAEQSSWLTLGMSYEEDFSFIFDKAWLVYLTKDNSNTINLNLPPIEFTLETGPVTNFFTGLNLRTFYSLSEIIGDDSQQLLWPKDFFQQFHQETGKESTCILRYDSHRGKWQAKYQFFSQAAGPESQLKREGYIVYLQ